MCLTISTPPVLPPVGRKTSAPRACLTPLRSLGSWAPLRSRQAGDEAQTLRFPHRSLFALLHPEFRQFSHGLRDLRSCNTRTGPVHLPFNGLRTIMNRSSILDGVARGSGATRATAFVATRQITPQGLDLLSGSIDEGVDCLAADGPQPRFVARLQGASMLFRRRDPISALSVVRGFQHAKSARNRIAGRLARRVGTKKFKKPRTLDRRAQETCRPAGDLRKPDLWSCSRIRDPTAAPAHRRLRRQRS